jgi:predicted protein tyrosine phosphatase
MKVFVMSKMQFKKLMVDNNITDDNVETKGDVMLISINDSNRAQGFRPTHFQRNHPNVMIMQFDDVENEGIPLMNGGTAVVFSQKMAHDLFQFIKRNKHRKTAVVHCEAGISRSGAVGSFIQGYCGGDWEEFKRTNPHIHPNGRVLRMLNKEKYNDKI